MNKNVLIDVPMPIVTPRLILRPPQEGDGQAVHEAKLESYDELYQWMIWIDKDKKDLSVETDEIMCREKQAEFILRKDLMLLVFDKITKKFIGSTGIHQPSWGFRDFTTGYWVRTSETGKGYATELATAVARYCFLVLKAQRLNIIHAHKNEASKRVILKTGYIAEGIKKQCHTLPNGNIVDEYFYGLLSLDDVPELDMYWG